MGHIFAAKYTTKAHSTNPAPTKRSRILAWSVTEGSYITTAVLPYAQLDTTVKLPSLKGNSSFQLRAKAVKEAALPVLGAQALIVPLATRPPVTFNLTMCPLGKVSAFQKAVPASLRSST
eukprot:CAMPEP_0202960128 /NCGR_PEP_ID=MMETSP1396-20130829/4276_1 /ASSEMBLY_ACC=CAM_ASM_000872 /TAXON_ID= /ORGANISM="Pseudokeronopsis sp., Strain Brazil" /LENGTH=119 /DNA_ID=CAMNT_0049679125 /DNA_START=923 /DNA_END=1282 /DNA_ORIENTATION=-